MTPPDFARELGARRRQRVRGRADAAPVRLRSASPTATARVRGLYHVGGGTHPGAGIPGVLLGAEVTAGLVAARTARVAGARALTPIARRGARRRRAGSRGRSRSPAGCCRATCATTSTALPRVPHARRPRRLRRPGRRRARRRGRGVVRGRRGRARARRGCSPTSTRATAAARRAARLLRAACATTSTATPIDTEAELDRYCYRVAGTVGVMMAALLGTRDRRRRRAVGRRAGHGDAAHEHPARHRRGPRRTAASTSPARRSARFGVARARARARRSLRDQIARADALYDEGIAGIPLLPRGRRAIRAAAGDVPRDPAPDRARGLRRARRAARSCRARASCSSPRARPACRRARAVFRALFARWSPRRSPTAALPERAARPRRRAAIVG